jgi:hypothetical protein
MSTRTILRDDKLKDTGKLSSDPRIGPKVSSLQLSCCTSKLIRSSVDKENDVVARAKLEAKKKYGTQAQQETERKKFVDERVKDDYGRLLGRQTAQFAEAMAQLAPFRVGHSDDFVTSNMPRFDFHNPYVQAGKLLLDVLPALAETLVSERSQRAADALLSALEHGNPDEGSFFSFIEVLSDDELIQRGIDKVLGQLLNARPEDRRASRSQASPAGGQLAPPVFGTSPDSAGLSLQRLTWKEPATLKDNNFAPSPATRTTEPPRLPSSPFHAPRNLTPPPSQPGFMPSSSSSAYLTPSTIMPPPPPAQARSSGRERKPTAKVLAAGTEAPSRPSAASPSAPSRPTLTRNVRSAPRVPSKLGFFESITDQEETPAPSIAPTAGRHAHTSSEGTSSTATTPDQRTFTPTIGGPLIPPVVPRSFQQPHPKLSPNLDLQPGLDPQLTANLLQLAEIAANMSDSDDDELEMEQNDLPYHERLIRILKAQSSSAKWHIATPISVEKSGKPPSTVLMPSATHSQTAVVDAAPAPPASLPPVNTIMSTKEAQVASSFFKSLAVGEPAINNEGRERAQSDSMNPYAGADRSDIPARNLYAGNTMANGITSLGRLNAVESGAVLPRLPGPEAQNGHAGSNVLGGKTQLGALNTTGQDTVLPHLSRSEAQAAIGHHGTISPQRVLLPLERKRKFEDEGYDIATSRLRSHAESRGLVVDPKMSYEQLTAMIDDHDRVTRHAHNGINGPSMSPVSTRPYGNGLAMNGNAAYVSTGLSSTMDRPRSSDGLRRLVPSSPWLAYNHHYPPYNLLPPRSPAAQYPPSPNNFSHPDAQRPPNGHVNNAFNKSFQFVPPKQPGQFTNRNSPVIEKTPSITNGDDPRQQHQDALNGGPPGGGAVINSRTTKRQQTSNTANFKFLVNGKDTPIAQSQPKRGGQLMTFS